MPQLDKIFIPTFISSIDFKPARVLPHIYFYNGVKYTNPYYIEYKTNGTGSVVDTQLDLFPYFDNYNGNDPTSGSKSLLFNNETAAYGTTPSGSLYSEYWETYVNLLYSPYTRLFDCDAIIPLADYFKMNLNDIVEWRGNYYHLRAINDYNLSNGECSLQLLGPVIGDVIAATLPGNKCNFDFTIGVTGNLTRTITLIDRGVDSGPFYGVYQSTDGINYTFIQNVNLPSVGSTTSITFTTGNTILKLVDLSACGGEIVHVIPGTLGGDFNIDFSALDFNVY